MKSKHWFDVDRDGLRELYGSLPLHRLVFELVQNAWDENTRECSVSITEAKEGSRALTRIVVQDDNPEGFRNLTDAFTLFRTTEKRSDPTKRGRFNLGEKLVICRAHSASIVTTKGSVTFDRDGRSVSTRRHTEQGSVVEILLKGYNESKVGATLERLKLLIPPVGMKFRVDESEVVAREPEYSRHVSMTTEVLSSGETGEAYMTRTARITQFDLLRPIVPKSHLYEMGIPVCEIAGTWDVNVHQKVPLTQDRTAVTEAFLVDVYAEIINTLDGRLSAGDIKEFTEDGVMSAALNDPRVAGPVAKEVFTAAFGQRSAIQSHNPDADQTAARHGYALVPSRMFGAAVNDKLREAGVRTTYEIFSPQAAESTETVTEANWTPDQRNFILYAKLVAQTVYPGHSTAFSIGNWTKSDAAAYNFNKTSIVFHVSRVEYAQPFKNSTTLILHELAHCVGNGHDGVYDHEFERICGLFIVAVANNPGMFTVFDAPLPPA